MKRIIIFRHGKSSWAHPGLEDVDRPLLNKGEQRTRNVAEKLSALNISAGIIVTSHAVRALRTATIAAEIFNISNKSIIVDPNLYHASADAIWDVIFSLPDDINSVMLFGHNPGFTDFVNSSGIAGIDWLPTSGAATALFNCQHWHQCTEVKPQNPVIILPEKT